MNAQVLLGDEVILHLLLQRRRDVICETGVAEGTTDEFGIEGQVR